MIMYNLPAIPKGVELKGLHHWSIFTFVLEADPSLYYSETVVQKELRKKPLLTVSGGVTLP